MNRVVKVGGSLLDWPPLEETLQHWIELTATRGRKTLLLAGGGTTVEGIREAQSTQGFSDAVAHWRAIDAMNDNGVELASSLGWSTVTSTEEVASLSDMPAVFLPRSWSESVSSLPTQWSVTSDSIALALAQELAQSSPGWKLVVMKSATPPWSQDNQGAWPLGKLAQQGYIDSFFPTLFECSEPMSLDFINLRLKDATEGRL